jgi:hypothetical protein
MEGGGVLMGYVRQRTSWIQKVSGWKPDFDESAT